MSFYGHADIPAMLAEFGVDVSIGGMTGKGLHDTPGVESFGSEVAGVSDVAGVLIVDRAAFPSPEPGVEVIVDSVIYVIRDSLPIEDGALLRLTLSFV